MMGHQTWDSLVSTIKRHRASSALFFKPVCVIAAIDLANEGRIDPNNIASHAVIERFSAYITPFYPDRGKDGYKPLWHLSNDGLWTFFDGGTPLTTNTFPKGTPATKATLFAKFDRLAIHDELRELWDSPKDRKSLRDSMLLILDTSDTDSRRLIAPLFNEKYFLNRDLWPSDAVLNAYFRELRDQQSLFDEEAEIVRHIFTRYADLGSVRELKTELDRVGIVSKIRTSKTGNVSGGKHLSRGALYKMLSNRIYIGEIVHKEKSYPGEHVAIVDAELWERVQTLLNDNAVERRAGTNAKDPSLLTGLVFDDEGNPLTPSHANKQGVRYRYYVGDQNDGKPSTRLPGREIEDLVVGQIISLLKDPAQLFDAMPEGDADVAARRALLDRAQVVASRLGTEEHAARKNVVHGIVSRIDVGRDAISLSIDRGGLANLLLVDGYWAAPHSEDRIFQVSCPYRIKRRGIETRLIVSNETTDRPARPDPALMRAVAKAFVWNKQLVSGEVTSGRSIARSENVTPRYIYKLLPLAHLAPDIVSVICEGRQPPDLTLDTLVYSDMPTRWEDQRRKFGFPAI